MYTNCFFYVAFFNTFFFKISCFARKSTDQSITKLQHVYDSQRSALIKLQKNSEELACSIFVIHVLFLHLLLWYILDIHLNCYDFFFINNFIFHQLTKTFFPQKCVVSVIVTRVQSDPITKSTIFLQKG